MIDFNKYKDSKFFQDLERDSLWKQYCKLRNLKSRRDNLKKRIKSRRKRKRIYKILNERCKDGMQSI